MTLRSHKRRAGISLLELEVAFVVFGLALSGVAPLVVMYSRQVGKLESRLRTDTTYYLAPSSDPWARKLGTPATITTTSPTAGLNPPPAAPVNLVDVLSLEKSFAGEDITVTVSLNPVGP